MEVLCRKGKTNTHGECTAVFRRFSDIKLQLPHFRGGFGFTPNTGGAISAFYAAFVSVVQWLDFCSHSEQNFIDLASTWAPGQDLAKRDLWTAPILIAIKQAHQVLLTDFGSHARCIDGLAHASIVPQIEGSSPNPGYDDLVWDVSLVRDWIHSSTQHGPCGKLQLCDYCHARARSKISKFRRDYAAKNFTFVPAILSIAGKIHPELLRLLWVMADTQTSLPHPSSSPHQPPVLASDLFPSSLVPSLPALLAVLQTLLLHLRQVIQCAVPCPFLADIACHYESLYRSLIPLSPPSLLRVFPSTTGEST